MASEKTIFDYANDLPKPFAWELNNFCFSAFSDIKRVPSANVPVDEIRHYKETGGLEHEFLLARIKGAESDYLLRIERSTSTPVRRTFWQKLMNTSSSILPAFDTVCVSPSLSKLTSGMNRGPSIQIATLSLPSSSNFTMHEFCLLLSLFPAFSPVYKLKEEQCYWFCNVILSVISMTVDSSIKREEEFRRAGTYKGISINLSDSARQLFINTYKIIYSLQNTPAGGLFSAEFTPDIAKTLTFMLSLPSDEVKRRATSTLISIASGSSTNRRMLVDAGSSHQLSQIFLAAPIDLKALILVALDALGVLGSFDPLPDDRLLSKIQGLEVEVEDGFATESKALFKKRDRATRHLFDLLHDPQYKVFSNAERMLTNFIRHDVLRPLTLDHLCLAIQSDTPRVVVASIKLLESLAQYSDTHAKLHEILRVLFPIMLKDESIQTAATDCMSKMISLSTDGFRADIRSIFEKAIESMKDNNVRDFTTKLITNVASHHNFTTIIIDVFPSLVDLLADKSWKTRKAAIELFSDLLLYTDYHSHIKEAIPKVFESFKFNNKDVNISSARCLAKVASNSAFTPVIFDLSPWIIGQLEDESWNARFSSTHFLYNLIPQADFSSHITEAVPQVLCLFEDDNWSVRLEAICFVEKAAFDSKYEPVIRDAFPQLIDLLEDKSWIRVDTVLNLLSRLVSHSMFQSHAQKIVPKMVSLLNFSDHDVMCSVGKFLSNAVNNSICRALILEEFSQIVGLLTNESWLVRQHCIDFLSHLFHYDDFRTRVQEVIPEVVKLLQDRFKVQTPAFELLQQLTPLSDAHPAIIDAIPQIIRLYNTSHQDIREEAMRLLSSLLDYSDIRPHLQTAISTAKEKNRRAWDAQVHPPVRELLAKAAKYGMT